MPALIPACSRPASSPPPRRTCPNQGSPYLRRAPWLAAVSASRSNPDLAAYLQRRLDQSKPWGTALGAIARKLLSRIYVVLKHNRSYEVR